jgi:tetratricopeptide (TPR) repeat protein
VLAACVLSIALGTVARTEERAPVEAVALAVHGMAALGAGHYGEALVVFSDASSTYPGDPLLCTGAGLAATMLGRQSEAIGWLERALRLDDDQAEAVRVLGELYYRMGRAHDAIALYEHALALRPASPLAERLDAWRHETQLHETFSSRRGAHFTVLFEGPADEGVALRSLDLLEAAYDRIGAVLNVYPTEPVTVVLYTPEQFRSVTRLPAWAAGAYDGRIRVPITGAETSPAQLEEVLAHEFAHALVASLAGPSVPTWLDEGLASVMALGGARDTAEDLSRATTRLPLSTLRQRFSQLPEDLASLAYAQSVHAVQRLFELRGASAVVSLLRDLGEGEPFERAFEHHAGMSLKDFETLVAR